MLREDTLQGELEGVVQEEHDLSWTIGRSYSIGDIYVESTNRCFQKGCILRIHGEVSERLVNGEAVHPGHR